MGIQGEWVSGNIFIRPNVLEKAGDRVEGHTHNFDHTTFIRRGWVLIRGRLPNGGEVVQQFASPDFEAARELLLKYAPDEVLRPVRFADAVVDGRPQFNVQFISATEPVPEGAQEIEFAPAAWHALIKANVEHEILALAPTVFDCTYSHRTPQGDVVQDWNGWENSAYV